MKPGLHQKCLFAGASNHRHRRHHKNDLRAWLGNLANYLTTVHTCPVAVGVNHTRLPVPVVGGPLQGLFDVQEAIIQPSGLVS